MFRKNEAENVLVYECKTLEDLLHALQSHQASGYPMDVAWWGFDDGSLCVEKTEGLPDIFFEP